MQSIGSRALVALAAIALVVVAFFVLRGDDDAGDGSGADADPTTTTTSTTATADDGPAEDKPKQDKPAAKPEVPAIVIKDGAPANGVIELEFDKGDEIAFTVTANTDQEQLAELRANP